MSEFFESDFVRKGMQDIEDLQVDLQRGFTRFPSLDEEEQQKQLELLETLLEKQQLMYTRMKLSDDPKAHQIVEDMRDSLSLLGMPPGSSVEQVFMNMKETLRKVRDGELDPSEEM